MKKIWFLLISCIFIINAQQAQSMVVYKDELPIEYINEIKSRELIRDEPDFPEYEKKDAITIKIRAKEKYTFTPQTLPQSKPMTVNTIITNAKINEKYTFVVIDDVYKNDKLFIKKGTIVTGLLRKAHQGLYNKGPKSEIKIGLFTTTNTENQAIKLKGAVIVNPMPQLMNVVITPKTTFKLYYK